MNQPEIATGPSGAHHMAFPSLRISGFSLGLARLTKPAVILGALIALTIPFQLMDINRPFVGEHEFRQKHRKARFDKSPHPLYTKPNTQMGISMASFEVVNAGKIYPCLRHILATLQSIVKIATNTRMAQLDDGPNNGGSAQPPKWRVLIFPGGTEIGLELRQALAYCKEVKLFSAGAAVSSHAPYVFARHFEIPMVGEHGWLEALQKIVKVHRISHIFPAHDDALLALAEHTSQLVTKVVTSPLRTCKIARSKAATIHLLRGALPTPRLYSGIDDVVAFPVFLKPDRGQGSWRTDRADNLKQLQAQIYSDPNRLILEHLPGPEYTIDCFSDRERGLLYAEGRERRRVKYGISMNSVMVDEPCFAEYARRISALLEFHGAWFFQLKRDRDGVLKLLEVAPRVGGTSALSRVRGVNLPLLSLYEADREVVSLISAEHCVEIDRALVNRYRVNLSYSTLYVDFDDTLVIRGQLNFELIKLLYQALSKKIRLVLLTRHAGKLKEALCRFRLENLFDDIIHLKPQQAKSDFIMDKKGVLIDDSFAERTAVRSKAGIPVFDPSMIEVLLDERI